MDKYYNYYNYATPKDPRELELEKCKLQIEELTRLLVTQLNNQPVIYKIDFESLSKLKLKERIKIAWSILSKKVNR